MLKRVLTGVGIVALLVGLFLSKLFLTTVVVDGVTVGMLVFDFALLVMAEAGTYEMTRALGARMTVKEKVVALLFPPIAFGFASFTSISFVFSALAIYVLLALGLLVFAFKSSTIESVGLTIVCLFYPTVFLVMLVAVNTVANFEALLLVFVVSPFCDTSAFFVGSMLKGKKLCPEISPNKTISGAIGGVVGGLVGGLVVYFGMGLFATAPVLTGMVWLDIVLFGVIGAVFAVLTEVGDLAESTIKRKIGVKDMGNVLPGHGGVMDRIDGLLFVAPVACVIFCLLPLIF